MQAEERLTSSCSSCCTFCILCHRLILPAVVQPEGKYHVALELASLDSSRYTKRDLACKEEMTFFFFFAIITLNQKKKSKSTYSLSKTETCELGSRFEDAAGFPAV